MYWDDVISDGEKNKGDAEFFPYFRTKFRYKD